MKNRIFPKITPRRQALILWMVVATLVLGSSLTHDSVYAIERGPLNQALLATVQVVVPVADEEELYSTGSGTVLTDDGLILTNYHVMGEIATQSLYNDNGFAGIAVNPTNLRSAPILKYAATMVGGDPNLDLALLRIVGLLEDTNAPLPANLGLVPVVVGDSETIEIGDEINAMGFPGIGGDTVTFTSGRISGFLDEDKDGYSEWLKADININHGNSGGLATNALGEMVGVPTQGRSDLGMIGLIRDGNLALDFVKRALLQEQTGTRPSATGPYVNNVQFAQAIDYKGQPLQPSVSFPSGTEAIYATFDYGNFTESGNFRFSWFHDGFRIYQDSVVWTYGRDGSTWVNVFEEEGLADGFYEVEITLDDVQLYRDGVIVGESQPDPNGAFGPITFAEGVDANDEPLNPGTLFSEISEIYAFFDVNNVSNGTQWTRRWYLDGEAVSEQSAVWNLGEVDYTWISLYADGGLPEGRYELELIIEGQVVQAAEMEIAAEQSGVPDVREVMVTGAIVEADNQRRTIEGAAVYFLVPGVTVDEFLDDPQEGNVYASGVTDADGFYQLDRNLMPGEYYGVVVYKEGYRIVTVDDYQIDPTATSPWSIDVTMERR